MEGNRIDDAISIPLVDINKLTSSVNSRVTSCDRALCLDKNEHGFHELIFSFKGTRCFTYFYWNRSSKTFKTCIKHNSKTFLLLGFFNWRIENDLVIENGYFSLYFNFQLLLHF